MVEDSNAGYNLPKDGGVRKVESVDKTLSWSEMGGIALEKLGLSNLANRLRRIVPEKPGAVIQVIANLPVTDTPLPPQSSTEVAVPVEPVAKPQQEVEDTGREQKKPEVPQLEIPENVRPLAEQLITQYYPKSIESGLKTLLKLANVPASRGQEQFYDFKLVLPVIQVVSGRKDFATIVKPLMDTVCEVLGNTTIHGQWELDDRQKAVISDFFGKVAGLKPDAMSSMGVGAYLLAKKVPELKADLVPILKREALSLSNDRLFGVWVNRISEVVGRDSGELFPILNALFDEGQAKGKASIIDAVLTRHLSDRDRLSYGLPGSYLSGDEHRQLQQLRVKLGVKQ